MSIPGIGPSQIRVIWGSSEWQLSSEIEICAWAYYSSYRCQLRTFGRRGREWMYAWLARLPERPGRSKRSFDYCDVSLLFASNILTRAPPASTRANHRMIIAG